MRKIKLIVFVFGLIGLCTPVRAQEKFLEMIKDEMNKEFAELQKEKHAPYYMNFRAVDERRTFVMSTFGAIMQSVKNHRRYLVPQVRIGSPEYDNFTTREMGSGAGRGGPSVAQLSLNGESGEAADRNAIWYETESRYKVAVSALQQALGNEQMFLQMSDKSPSLSKTKIEKYYEPQLPAEKLTIDREAWGKRLNEISSEFKKYPEIIEGSAHIEYNVLRTYFISTEGAEIVHNLPYARIMVQASTMADDGMRLPLHLSYFAYDPDNLPSNDSIMKDVNVIAKKLIALRTAPTVDPFSGPALMSGAASGVFFHEIFGPRTEGQRMKKDVDGQTFKDMIGKLVLPEGMSVADDPTLRYCAGTELNGYYKYDEQGVKAERVDVVIDGKMNDFLMTRTALEGHARSNGHGRAVGGFDPVSRQSNLIISIKDPRTEKELRALLIEEIKKQNKEFGFYFKEVSGGFTQTGRMAINSFNVTPLEVYRVYADGRPDELVRGLDMIGTPLAMFSNIVAAGGQVEVFTGMCGAESGSIPVTAVSPCILVNRIEVQRVMNYKAIPPILERP